MSRPLRIAFLLGSFPVISETFILRQITGLLDLGHDVRIFANARPEESVPIHPEVAKFNLLGRTTYVDGPAESVVWELPVRPLTGQTWPPGATKSIANWRRFAAALPKLARCLRSAPGLTRQVLDTREYRYQAASFSGVYRLATLCRATGEFDVLHAHFGPVGNSFRFARELWNAPLVVSFHGYDFSTFPRSQGASVYERLFVIADAVTVNSDYTRSQVERLGCPAQKIRKLPVGLDPEEFPFRERTLSHGQNPRILSVGRLVEIKGHEFVIRAAAKLREKYPTIQFDIVGDGPLRSKLEKLVDELGLRKTVSLRGTLDGSEVRHLMDAAHLFVLASVNVEGDQEGQGLVLQEAQASGLPLVATRHGAFPEGIAVGESGFLVPERDVAAVAERLDFLLANPGAWPAMGRAGRKFVEPRYDVRKLNRQLVESYDEAVRNFAGPGRRVGGN